MDVSDTPFPDLPSAQPVWISVREAAELLRVSPQTVRNWVQDGRLVASIEPNARRMHWNVALASVQEMGRARSGRHLTGEHEGAERDRLQRALDATHRELDDARARISELEAFIALRADSHDRLRKAHEELAQALDAEHAAGNQLLFREHPGLVRTPRSNS